MQKYYHNEPKFNGVYSRKSLLKIKDGAYIINLDEFKKLIGQNYMRMVIIQPTLAALELNIFSNKLGKSQETKVLFQIFIEYKHFCIGFSDFMLKGKSLPKNNKMILKYFH